MRSAEGHDLSVLRSYPFDDVDTWRVQFETKHLSMNHGGRLTRLQEARALLRSKGFLPISSGHDDETWHHVASREHFLVLGCSAFTRALTARK